MPVSPDHTFRRCGVVSLFGLDLREHQRGSCENFHLGVMWLQKHGNKSLPLLSCHGFVKVIVLSSLPLSLQLRL